MMNEKLKILCLFDGALHDVGYRFDTFLSIIEEDNSLGKTCVSVITKVCTKFKKEEFDFSEIHKYHVLFLFGMSSEYKIKNKHVKEFQKFMRAGKGIFGAGDHADLGLSLCGKVPRLRHMRNWGCNPKSNAHNRLTTMRPTGLVANQNDERDLIPQRIYPYIFSDNRPHYLLQFPFSISNTKFVNYFPDHPHEGECYQPNMDSSLYQNEGNFPGRVKIRGVAKSMSAGFGLGNSFPAVSPREFISVSAYDGHKAQNKIYPDGVGRIVADATWHHFLNINLDGFKKARDPQSIAVYDGMKQYYKNIVTWLAPLKFQEKAMRNLFEEALKKHPYAEIVSELEFDGTHKTIIRHGQLLKETLGTMLSPAQFDDLIESLIEGSYKRQTSKRGKLRDLEEKLNELDGKQDYFKAKELFRDIVLGQAAYNYYNWQERGAKDNSIELDGVFEKFQAFSLMFYEGYFSYANDALE